MARIKKYLKRLWQEQGYTLTELGAAMVKAGSTTSGDRARMSSWFGHEGIPDSEFRRLLEVLHVPPLLAVWFMDAEDMVRYAGVLLDEDEELTRRFRAVAALSEEEVVRLLARQAPYDGPGGEPEIE